MKTIKDLLIERSVKLPNGCRVWTWGKHSNGYGVLNYRGIIQRTHVIAYEEFNGRIPKGMEVRHTCDNPSCIEPNHLRLGTHADNMRDMLERGRHFTPFFIGEPPPTAKVNASQRTLYSKIERRDDRIDQALLGISNSYQGYSQMENVDVGQIGAARIGACLRGPRELLHIVI